MHSVAATRPAFNGESGNATADMWRSPSEAHRARPTPGHLRAGVHHQSSRSMPVPAAGGQVLGALRPENAALGRGVLARTELPWTQVFGSGEEASKKWQLAYRVRALRKTPSPALCCEAGGGLAQARGGICRGARRKQEGKRLGGQGRARARAPRSRCCRRRPPNGCASGAQAPARLTHRSK
jgi:hypothetical protein